MRKVMYIVINQDLNMSTGKVGAHTAHAVMDYIIKSIKYINYCGDTEYTKFHEEIDDMYYELREFIECGDTIVVLKAHEEDLLKWEKEGYVSVRDRGLTEIEPSIITAINLGIYDKDKGIPKWIQRLRLL